MKLCTTTFLIAFLISLVSSRPQTVQFEHVDDAVRLPYIGGAKGQILEIRQRPDGTIFSRILMDEIKSDMKKETFAKPEVSSFEDSLASIQRAAAELVSLQKTLKESGGGLSDDQKRQYALNLEKLGISAQKLANVQEGDDFRLLIEEPQGDRIKTGGSKKKNENVKFPPYAKKPTPPPRMEECGGDEETVGEEGEPSSSSTTSSTAATTSTTTTKQPETSSSSENESVSVTSADGEDDSSSVAEAKPVGLAIAGVGGVASSKPVATAVVGPGGLAVARPVATAIAGIKPSEVSSLGLPIPSKLKDLAARGGNFPFRGKFGLVTLSDDDREGNILVGPEYFSTNQGRLSNTVPINSDRTDQDDFDDDEDEISRQDSEDSEDFKDRFSNKNEGDRQVEPVESPYEIAYGKQPLFAPSYEGFYNLLPNPYLPPYSFNIPLPLMNQYLQRNAYRQYPSRLSQYPSIYGQNQYNGNLPFSRYSFV